LNLPVKLYYNYCKFRTGNTKLPIPTGRWFTIARENRICKLCKCKDIGDEFHNVFRCTDICIQNDRVVYLPKFCLKTLIF
jgi:hypothetical protein